MPALSYENITDRALTYCRRSFDEMLLEVNDFNDYEDFVDRSLDWTFLAGDGFSEYLLRDCSITDINMLVTMKMIDYIVRCEPGHDFEGVLPTSVIDIFAYYYVRDHTPDYEARFHNALENNNNPNSEVDDDYTDTEDD